jgi:hypothetical protein
MPMPMLHSLTDFGVAFLAAVILCAIFASLASRYL